MNERKAFLRALAKNEDDVTTRLIYADWLDEHGEHEEADRQRKWPAAKEWLIRFCRDNNEDIDEDEEPYLMVISYEDLLELGRQAVEQADRRAFWFECGNNDLMCDALRENSRDFWKNWSIVTGIPLPPDIEDKTHFSCAC